MGGQELFTESQKGDSSVTCVTFEGQFLHISLQNFLVQWFWDLNHRLYNIQVSMNENQLDKIFRLYSGKFCGYLKTRDVCDARWT